VRDNRANLSATPLSVAINELMACAEPPEPKVRHYLGASAIGSYGFRVIRSDYGILATNGSWCGF
jgi:hypothetical protein